MAHRPPRPLPVNFVGADVHTPNRVPFNIEGGSEITFDDNCVDYLSVSRRELMDLVGTQTRIKRVSLENLESSGCGPFLPWRQFR
jgi:hypothetical protein